MRKKKEPEKKPYRSTLSNTAWSFRNLMKSSPRYLLLMALEVPLNVFLAYANIYLPSLVVAKVTEKASTAHSMSRIGALILLMLAAGMLLSFTSNLSQVYLGMYRSQKTRELDKKAMSCFYQTYEKKENRDLLDRALIATQMWDGQQPISDIPKRSLKLAEYILCYCLFGSVVSFVSPWLVPILTIAPAVNWLCARAYRNWEYSHRDRWTDIDRKLWYVQNKPSDFSASKDIRIYGMAGWFREIFSDLSSARAVWDKQLIWRDFFSKTADLLIILLRDGAAYALLIQMTLAGNITVDKFVLYFSAISMFASFIGNIMNEWNRMRSASLKLCDYREYMDIPEPDTTGSADIETHLHAAPEITFEHVSFRYAGAQTDTLQDISFTIKPGEKIALVGLNGAGKTTLVKLLCGLYQPTGGDIKINGISVRQFFRRDYYRLFSPVFQDVRTAFFSLAETVSGKVMGGTDEARAEQCLRLAGLGEKIDALPQGIHTRLDKQVNAEGIELSGGELQKLMLARALYKDAPILVLDEPTAALDPIAENQIYLQYRSLTEAKTSLFISHRLASTQFCDRILYLQDGRIAEEGTHAELIALGGEYSRLFEMQSCWYQKDYEGGAA